MLRASAIALSLALPLLAAAKPVIDNEGHAYLTIYVLGANAPDQGQQLEVQSWQWGPRQSTGRVVSGEVFYKPPASSGAAGDMPKDLQRQDRMGDSASAGHSMLGASDRTTIHDPPPPRDGGLGSESELTAAGPRGDQRGSLTVRASLPGCQAGKRYAGAQFASGGMSGLRYELKDVVISNCAPGEVTLDYARVRVRAWNPEKKEE